MLAGQPPFQGRTAAQLLAAHATERPVAVRDRRRAVPVALGDTIMQLLEKRPADRPQSAEELLSVLEVSQAAADPAPTERLSSSGSAVSARSLAPQRGRWVIAAAAMLAVVLLLAWLTRRHPSATVDRSVVAVAPFRVSGADSSLGYLREGMVDLLAAKLSGTSGIRAADPRTLLAAWRRKAKGSGDLREQDAIEVAERIGAGRLIEGDVVGNRQRININAAVLDAADHRVTAQASVEGSPDSLTRLVDQLAIKLLALEAGESEQRLPNLTSTSLPALRAYLEGQELMRRGEFKQAYERFRLAIQQDSTFGLAALGEMRAAGWIASGREDFAQALAWKYRDRLSPVDRALLEVYVGSRPPAPPRWSEAVTSAERLVRLAPDNAEAWYELGDGLYHYGPLIGLADAGKRAAQAFAKSIALDSSFAPALEHGPLLALSLGDTSGARTALARTMRIDSTSAIAAASRWLMAMVTGDSASRRQLLQSDSLGAGYMISLGLSAGVPIEDAAAVLARKRAVAVTADEQARVQRDARNQALITGWPSRAPPPPTDRPEPLRKTLLYIEGRWGDGDSVVGAAAADALLKTIGTPLAVGDYLAAERYTAGQRAYDRGRLDLAQRAIADLRSLPASEDSAWVREIPSGLALLLEAQLAARQNSPGLPNLLARLDSALIDASSFTLSTMGNLIIARLYERQGNLPAALAAIHRRLWNLSSTAIYLTYYREEGRLAALNGDREGAIKAYRRYLALRSGAEPRLQPQVAQVRAELQALERESTDR
jgi:serine/threonine-protein kinase